MNLQTLRRLFRAALLALAAGSSATPSPAQQEEKVLNVYNWSDYIADDTIANFEKETGIQVHYDIFDSNEILNAKLVAGHSGYDVVVPSSYWATVQVAGGLLKKLDKSQLPNLKNIDPAIQARVAALDPGNEFLVDWLWGYTTVGINVDKVRAALGGLPMLANVWDLLFKPEYVARLKPCGVSFLDSPTDVIPAAMHYLGKPPFSHDPADYRGVAPLLKAVRPSVTLFSSSGYINDLASGAVCAALGWSGDINIARRRAVSGKTGQRIEALIPDTGGVLFFDTMAIPADAPHPNNALKWINYMLRPEVAAGVSNKVFYANSTRDSKKLVMPEVANNASVFLGDADLRKMVVPDALTNDVRRTMTRLFTGFKTGF